ADAARVPAACDRPGRRYARLGVRRHRGAGVRIFGGAGPEGPAAELPRDYGGAVPDDRRDDRAALRSDTRRRCTAGLKHKTSKTTPCKVGLGRLFAPPTPLASGARDGAHTPCCSTTAGGGLTN